jgi:hypothetical protein
MADDLKLGNVMMPSNIITYMNGIEKLVSQTFFMEIGGELDPLLIYLLHYFFIIKHAKQNQQT